MHPVTQAPLTIPRLRVLHGRIIVWNKDAGLPMPCHEGLVFDDTFERYAVTRLVGEARAVEYLPGATPEEARRAAEKIILAAPVADIVVGDTVYIDSIKPPGGRGKMVLEAQVVGLGGVARDRSGRPWAKASLLLSGFSSGPIAVDAATLYRDKACTELIASGIKCEASKDLSLCKVPAFMLWKGAMQVRDADSGEVLPEFSGVAFDYECDSFVLTQLDGHERSVNYLVSGNYAAACAEAEGVKENMQVRAQAASAKSSCSMGM